MTVPNPSEFASAWLDAWNAHDLEAVLSHFHDDVVFTSPVAARLIEGCDGTLRGKAQLRNYWQEGLRSIPDLRFRLENVYAGLEAIVINYRNQKGDLVNEVLLFDDGLVVEGHGTYLESHPDNGGSSAGGSTTAIPAAIAASR